MSNTEVKTKPINAKKVQESLDSMLKRREEEDKLIAQSRAKLKTFNKAQEHKMNHVLGEVLREYASKNDQAAKTLATCLHKAVERLSPKFKIASTDESLMTKYPKPAQLAKAQEGQSSTKAPVSIATPEPIKAQAPAPVKPVVQGPPVVVVGNNTKPVAS